MIGRLFVISPRPTFTLLGTGLSATIPNANKGKLEVRGSSSKKKQKSEMKDW
jgi:hypothetical protein